MEFDHKLIINDACQLAERLLEDTPVATQFCEKYFTITHLRTVYEAILGHKVDAANFRKKIEAVNGFVVPVGTTNSLSTGAGRPARVYKKGPSKELNPPVRFRTK
jgi:8-oxo-dGTP diphosphatase